MHQAGPGSKDYCFDCSTFCVPAAQCDCCKPQVTAFPKTGETPGNRVEDYPAGAVDVSQYPVSASLGSPAEVTYETAQDDEEAGSAGSDFQ